MTRSPESIGRRLLEVQGWRELRAPERALEIAQELHAEVPDSSDVVLELARCLVALGRFAEALPLLTTAAQRPELAEEAFLAIGWCQKRLGRLDLAARAMEDILRLDPKSSIGHYNLACYLALAGDEPRCLAELKTALGLEPRYAASIDQETDFDPVRGRPEFQQLRQWGLQELERRGTEPSPGLE